MEEDFSLLQVVYKCHQNPQEFINIQKFKLKVLFLNSSFFFSFFLSCFLFLSPFVSPSLFVYVSLFLSPSFSSKGIQGLLLLVKA